MEGPKKRWLTAGLGTATEPGSIPSSGNGAPRGRAGTPGVAETSVISRKELARQYRRQAYQRAKQARATDPKHLAMKEAAKVRRREVYQQVKAQRKERDAELETKRKTANSQARAEAQRELAERVKSAIGRGSEPIRGSDLLSGPSPIRGPDLLRSSDVLSGLADDSSALARDIERALRNADVKELMERLRAESPALVVGDRAAVDREDAGNPEQPS